MSDVLVTGTAVRQHRRELSGMRISWWVPKWMCDTWRVVLLHEHWLQTTLLRMQVQSRMLSLFHYDTILLWPYVPRMHLA